VRLVRSELSPLAMVLERTAVLQYMRVSKMLRILWTVSTVVSALLELLQYLRFSHCKCAVSRVRRLAGTPFFLNGNCKNANRELVLPPRASGLAVVTYAHVTDRGTVAARRS
jgi:hypothetical protein